MEFAKLVAVLSLYDFEVLSFKEVSFSSIEKLEDSERLLVRV